MAGMIRISISPATFEANRGHAPLGSMFMGYEAERSAAEGERLIWVAAADSASAFNRSG